MTADDIRDEDRLPWLETADLDERRGPTALQIAAMALLALLLVGGIVFAVARYQDRAGGGGAAGGGELIAAQEGDYKVKPDEPGGMQVEGEGDTVFRTSEGGQGKANMDTSAVPEAPVAAAKPKATPSATATTSARVVAAVPATKGRLEAATPVGAGSGAAKPSSGGGSVVQLGSFPAQASAQAAWTGLSKRFSYLANLGHTVEGAEVNGKTTYRLRVNAGSVGAARDLCGKLRIAGEPCFIPN